jgi:hypothetical protein
MKKSSELIADAMNDTISMLGASKREGGEQTLRAALENINKLIVEKDGSGPSSGVGDGK